MRLFSAILGVSAGATALWWSIAASSQSLPATRTGIDYFGINLSGAELETERMAMWHGRERWPTNAEIDYFAKMKMNVIRLPINWPRVQPVPFGPIDQSELANIDRMVDAANARKMAILIDLHAYGVAYKTLIQGDADGARQLADFWSKMAARYKDRTNVWYGLMNEPHKQSATDWLPAVNRAIAAIRATGSRQPVLVSGSYWDKADTWMSTDNARVMGNGVVDSGNNFLFEVHWYPNVWGKITPDRMHGKGRDQAAAELEPITQWARRRHVRLFLGEAGVNTAQIDLDTLDGLLAYLRANGDAWAGLTYFAYAGPDNRVPFTIKANPRTRSLQTNVLLRYLPPALGSKAYITSPATVPSSR